MLNLRCANPDDADKLLEIYSYYVLNTAISLECTVPTVEEFRERIVNTLKKYPYFVLEADGDVIGYAYAGPFRSREAYRYSVECSVYLKNGLQKQGFGRMLVSALEENLRDRGFTNANVCIVYSENDDEYLNKNSMQFHSHMGYEFVGTFHKCAYKFDRWYDMIWMEKFVGDHGNKNT